MPKSLGEYIAFKTGAVFVLSLIIFCCLLDSVPGPIGGLILGVTGVVALITGLLTGLFLYAGYKKFFGSE